MKRRWEVWLGGEVRGRTFTYRGAQRCCKQISDYYFLFPPTGDDDDELIDDEGELIGFECKPFITRIR